MSGGGGGSTALSVPPEGPCGPQTDRRQPGLSQHSRLNNMKAGWSCLSLETSSIPLIPHVPTHTLKAGGKQKGREGNKEKGRRRQEEGQAAAQPVPVCLQASK